MTVERYLKTIDVLREKSNLIHCVTNPISINLLANGILALGCRPVMAEHPREVREIAETASAVLLNMGNITDARMESIKICSQAANDCKIPLVLDTAGISCSRFRRDFVLSLAGKYDFTLIKGNYSEIYALENPDHKSSGIDSSGFEDISGFENTCIRLARKYNCIILASGKRDIVTDGIALAYISNGTETLTKITGTGCLLGAICACFLSVYADMNAVIGACAFLGICAEMSETEKGTGSFAVNLLDNLSKAVCGKIKNQAEIEVKQIDEI